MADDYRIAFLTLLNNRPEDAPDGQWRRDRGFVVLVPGAKSLEPLQRLCFEQSWNKCYTARYRIGAGFGPKGLLMVVLPHLLKLRHAFSRSDPR